MSFQQFEIDIYCVGGRHRPATSKIYSDINSKGSKLLISFCSIVIEQKPTPVFDKTSQAEGLGSSSKNWKNFC